MSGDGVLRHQPLHDGFVAAEGQREGIAEAIDRHIEQFFGPVDFVYHEFGSHLVSVHVYVIEPTEARPFRTLITSGMSELPMTVPEGISPYAEVMLCLPADWPLEEFYPRNPGVDWPITVLKQVARLPHEYGTWIGEWHSLPNGDPAEPYAPGTPFAGAVITPMLRVPAEARIITAPDGTEINVLAVIPLHPDEVAVKIERGTDALIEILDRGRVTELLDPARPSFAVIR
ncbi:suppressor of fused domain protein [Actinoplanes italicus]|uniref:Suppressor of fused protein SUFU n=1 Tax=Actinoplanes italicus TaxID=113567 RepID=A0A2T0K7E8_9ACTN|nr:suppressor of fused domain protein [Actinoplanes italicus]PRX18947.1 suppressor of fused protein SUFU [Actinoplanes italicus]